jgi:plastocyanin
MRTITLLIAVVLVSALFVVPVEGAQRTRYVAIRDFSYQPVQITVTRETKVTWTNQDATPHTATANNGTSFASPLLRTGDRHSHTFKRVGKKPYHCKVHPHMRGTVVVRK